MDQHLAWVNHGRPSVRVRDTYIRDIAGPLLSRGADGAVKLDLVLRGLAALGSDAGTVPNEVSWAELHDMCRSSSSHLQNETALKQRWVNDKLSELERQGLVRRRPVAGKRSQLLVLSDRGDGSPFDDPGAVGDHYVTFLGNLVRFDQIGKWNSAVLAAYFAAMNAEGYARADSRFAQAAHLDDAPPGGGRWMRPLAWFNDAKVSEGPNNSYGRPADHVRYPFNERTLRRGFEGLRRQRFIAVQFTDIDPRTSQPFKAGFARSLYYNAFHMASADLTQRAYDLKKKMDAKTLRNVLQVTAPLRPPRL